MNRDQIQHIIDMKSDIATLVSQVSHLREECDQREKRNQVRINDFNDRLVSLESKLNGIGNIGKRIRIIEYSLVGIVTVFIFTLTKDPATVKAFRFILSAFI